MPRQLPTGYEVHFSIVGLSDARQQLVHDIFEVSHHWNWLELSLALMFTWLLGGEEDKAFDLYHNIVSQDLRFQLFMTLAKNALPKELMSECREAYEKVRDLRKQRAKVVHGVWGTCAKLPNALVLLNDPAAWSSLFHQRNKDLLAGDPHDVHFAILSEKCEAYEHGDFEALKAKIVGLNVRIVELSADVLGYSLAETLKKRREGAFGGLQTLLQATHSKQPGKDAT